MYGPRDTPEPIEKIRKPQWTVENTRKTQAVVDDLVMTMRSARRVISDDAPLIRSLARAIARFKELDKGIKEST